MRILKNPSKIAIIRNVASNKFAIVAKVASFVYGRRTLQSSKIGCCDYPMNDDFLSCRWAGRRIFVPKCISELVYFTPMIYLIGGSLRCGKTILSKRLALKERISLVSTDALRPMVLAMTPKSEIKRKFPQTNMPTPKNKFRFDVYSLEEMIKAQIVEAKTMWATTKAFIKSLVYRGQDYILEGVHLFPDLVNELKKTKVWKHIRIIYLIKTDLEKIKAGFSKNKDPFDWMYPSIKSNDERLTKAAEMVREKSIYIEKGCKKYNFKTFNTENNFDEKIREAQEYLIKK